MRAAVAAEPVRMTPQNLSCSNPREFTICHPSVSSNGFEAGDLMPPLPEELDIKANRSDRLDAMDDRRFDDACVAVRRQD